MTFGSWAGAFFLSLISDAHDDRQILIDRSPLMHAHLCEVESRRA
jgi:hypothetical protein